MRKYGLENFKFSILEECSISELANREDYWMHYYDCFIPKGYNKFLKKPTGSIPNHTKPIVNPPIKYGFVNIYKNFKFNW